MYSTHEKSFQIGIFPIARVLSPGSKIKYIHQGRIQGGGGRKIVIFHMKYPKNFMELTTSVVIGTDYIGSWKSNYHTTTATTDPVLLRRVCSFITQWTEL